MGWELRHGTRLYLYRSRRENGRPVKSYLAASADPFGFGDLMAHTLARLRRREARLRQLKRRVRTEYRARIDDLLRAVGSANADLRVLAEGATRAGVPQAPPWRVANEAGTGAAQGRDHGAGEAERGA